MQSERRGAYALCSKWNSWTVKWPVILLIETTKIAIWIIGDNSSLLCVLCTNNWISYVALGMEKAVTHNTEQMKEEKRIWFSFCFMATTHATHSPRRLHIWNFLFDGSHHQMAFCSEIPYRRETMPCVRARCMPVFTFPLVTLRPFERWLTICSFCFNFSFFLPAHAVPLIFFHAPVQHNEIVIFLLQFEWIEGSNFSPNTGLSSQCWWI